jgi:hypothetical protein
MHFLTSDQVHYGGRSLPSRRAAVQVRVTYGDRRSKKTAVLHVTDKIFVMKPDALMVELPDGVTVVDDDGKPIRPSGKFMVSVETFDPFHALVDVPKEW